MLPERVIDLGRVWHAQAREDVQRLGTMLRFVQHDMHDPSGEPQLFVKVVGEGLLFAQKFFGEMSILPTLVRRVSKEAVRSQ